MSALEQRAEQRADQRGEQRLLPAARLVAWTQVLALSAEGLDAYVAEQLGRHAALDAPAGRTCPRCGGTVWRAGAHACLAAGAPADPAAIPAADRGPLDDHLAALPAADARVARYLLADADPRGRIDRPHAAIAAALGVTAADVARVLDGLRAVAPPGFGARDTREALLLQLDRRPDAPALCRAVVEHLDDALAGRYAAASPADVRAALRWIAAHLQPGSAPDPPAAAPLPRPDLVVDAALTVRLADAPWRALRVAAAFERYAATDRAVARQVHAARAVVAGLAARGGALVRVAQEAVDRQAGWVRGTGGHRPLTRSAVAAAVGLHESTVSRAVAGKTMLLPDGRVVALADLFGTSRSPREHLRALLAAPDAPRSDAALARALTAAGFPTARRTVTKYRAQLGIPARR